MKGVTVASPGAPYVVVEDLEKPAPGPNQVLVKSLFSGINPVETYMQSTGVLVHAWPIVLGCDASGTVVSVGSAVTKFKEGDGVFGCTRLGVPGYGTFQEYHLMDEGLAFRKPSNITHEQAATLGVGSLTASLGLAAVLGLRFPEKGETPSSDEWIIVLGGSGAVGQATVQIARLCGYPVFTTCSPSNSSLLKSIGASATVDYKLELADQIAKIEETTGGNFGRVFDTSALSTAAALEILAKASKAKEKKFVTVDDWSDIKAPADVSISRIKLGMIGQPGTEEQAVTKDLESYIPYLETYVEEGKLRPMHYEIVGDGFEAVAEAVKTSNTGKYGGRKCVVKLA